MDGMVVLNAHLMRFLLNWLHSISQNWWYPYLSCNWVIIPGKITKLERTMALGRRTIILERMMRYTSYWREG